MTESKAALQPGKLGGDAHGAPAVIRLPLTFSLIVILVAAATPFLPTLGNELVWDDHLLFENNPVLLKPFAAFRQMLSLRDQRMPYYRPLSILWWSVERVLLRLEAPGLHLGNVLLHACVALLVLLIFRRLLPAMPALLGALVFAVHPVHVEPVAFACAGGTELLPATLILGSLLVLLPRPDRPREPGDPGRGRLRVSAGLFFCALLTKEMAVGLPLLAAVVLFARRPRAERSWKAVAGLMTPFAFAACGYAVLRAGAMLSHQLLPAQPTNPFAAWQVPAWLLASLKALLSPYRLLPYHELTPLSPAGYLLLVGLLAALGFCALVIGRARRWDLPVLLGLGLLLVPLIPTAPLLPRGGLRSRRASCICPRSASLCLPGAH